MEKNNIIINIIAIVLLSVVIFSIGYFLGKNKIINNNDIQQPDTTYNRIILDSIEYNIIKKDSIIYKIKEDAKQEIDYAINANDSVTVMLFQKLVSE